MRGQAPRQHVNGILEIVLDLTFEAVQIFCNINEFSLCFCFVFVNIRDTSC